MMQTGTDSNVASLPATDPMRLVQVAMSVPDLALQTRFYQRVLGFRRASAISLWGEGPSTVLALPEEACFLVQWMVDRQPFMQFEFFQFSRPKSHPRRADWRPCDIGYVRVGVLTPDFDGVIGRAQAAGHAPLTAPVVRDGLRRVCVYDPAGMLIEILEDGPQIVGGSPAAHWPVTAAIKYVTISVPDLDEAGRYFIDGFGLREDTTTILHRPEDEALWGLAGAKSRSILLSSGNACIELVEYTDPIGRPWRDGYLLSDIGMLNIALGCRSVEAFFPVYDRLRALGYRPNVVLPDAARQGERTSTYFSDDRGLSVEVVAMDKRFHGYFGFEPEDPYLTRASGG